MCIIKLSLQILVFDCSINASIMLIKKRLFHRFNTIFNLKCLGCSFFLWSFFALPLRPTKPGCTTLSWPVISWRSTCSTFVQKRPLLGWRLWFICERLSLSLRLLAFTCLLHRLFKHLRPCLFCSCRDYCLLLLSNGSALNSLWLSSFYGLFISFWRRWEMSSRLLR